MIRVLLVDDEALLRAGFRMVLEAAEGIQVVGEAADGIEAVSAARHYEPDIVLMDVRMPRKDGITAAREILAAPQAPRVVMLTTFDLDEYIYDALRAGASGFLLKDADADDLVAAVRLVADGNAVLQPAVTTRLVQAFASGKAAPMPESTGPVADLTERETEVFRLMGKALSNAEIARDLNISENTTKTHVARVLMKLELRDRAQAVVKAYELGVVRP